MFDNVLIQVAALAGFAGLFALVINVLKVFGIVKDGDAQLWSAGLNLVLILVVYFSRIFWPSFDFALLAPIAQEVAAVGTFVLSFIVQLLSTRLANFAVKGLPVIGKSFSLEAKKNLG